ncbi:MAG: tRNA (adenosine(37)-N6)-threonylcarbamoyltransferase complex dimerization subunit type 1 TsaB [Terracidiphilus sp.]
MQPEKLLLAIDTCGPSGSVTLGRLSGQFVEILGQIELAGRSYSATLVAAVEELLVRGGVTLREVGAIVAVNGPGSFTGVRVGLSAVKGLAEAARIQVLAVSRLEVLSWKAGVPSDRSSSLRCMAGVPSAALDALRHEVFLRIDEQEGRGPQLPILGPGKSHLSTGHSYRELLAGVHELAAIEQPPPRIAVCDDAAQALLASAWPAAELVRTLAPAAADALQLCARRVAAGEFVDVALLDGHYLRRSDAEIFGEPAGSGPRGA